MARPFVFLKHTDGWNISDNMACARVQPRIGFQRTYINRSHMATVDHPKKDCDHKSEHQTTREFRVRGRVTRARHLSQAKVASFQKYGPPVAGIGFGAVQVHAGAEIVQLGYGCGG